MLGLSWALTISTNSMAASSAANQRSSLASSAYQFESRSREGPADQSTNCKRTLLRRRSIRSLWAGGVVNDLQWHPATASYFHPEDEDSSDKEEGKKVRSATSLS